MDNRPPMGFNPNVGPAYSPYPPINQGTVFPQPQQGVPPNQYCPETMPQNPAVTAAPGWFGNAATAVMAAQAFQRPGGDVGFSNVQPQNAPYPSTMPQPGMPAAPAPIIGMPSATGYSATPPAMGSGSGSFYAPPTTNAPLAMPGHSINSVSMPSATPYTANPPVVPMSGMASPALPQYVPTQTIQNVSQPPGQSYAPVVPVAGVPNAPGPAVPNVMPLPAEGLPNKPATIAASTAPLPSDAMPLPATDNFNNAKSAAVPSASNYGTVNSNVPNVAKLSLTDESKNTSAQSSMKKTRGSIKYSTKRSAQEDAEILKKAMKGFGCDEKAITFIMYSNSYQQRQEIILQYKTLFGKDLIKCLKSELSGKTEDAVMAALKKPEVLDAHELRKAMKGLGTTESTLIEIICSRNNRELAEIKRAYKEEFDRDLENDVASETSGHFRKFLISLLQANRSEDQNVNTSLAAKEAKELYNAGEARWGTDESKFKTLLAARSYSHLRAIFQEYRKICKYDIAESIKREMSGDLKKSMIAVVTCAESTPRYFASCLNKALKGSVDSSTITRIIISRSEIDMEDVKEEYLKLFGVRLEDVIEEKCSSYHKRMMLGFLGARK